MTKCDCRKRIEEKLCEQLESPRINYDMFSGKTFSTVSHTETIKGKS